MKKLLLITPPYHCGVVEVAGRWLPLNLLYLATAARHAGLEVRLFDAISLFEGAEEIAAAVNDFAPDFVGIPSITAAIVRCYRDFYMSKMRDFAKYPDEFRRHYMMSSMKLIMKSSFLVKKMGSLAIPQAMRQKMAL